MFQYSYRSYILYDNKLAIRTENSVHIAEINNDKLKYIL